MWRHVAERTGRTCISRPCTGESTIWQRGRGRQQQRGRRTRTRIGRSRARGQSVQEEEPEREPLLIINICNKTDEIQKDFAFTPTRPEGLYIPDGVDTSNPEDLFKLFFMKRWWIIYASQVMNTLRCSRTLNQ